jgi:Tfp pilus assembly protein PilF
MTRLRLAFALTILAAFAGNVYAAPLDAPEAEVIGHLAAVLATHDPARISYAYRAMGDYGTPAADFVESTVNAMGYELLQNGEIEAAIRVFGLNTDTFPLSANAWDSLAEATTAKGDHESATHYNRVALKLSNTSNNRG